MSWIVIPGVPWFHFGKENLSVDGHGYVLAQFSRKRNAALRDYRRLVEEGMGMGRIPELKGGGLVRTSGGFSQMLSLKL